MKLTKSMCELLMHRLDSDCIPGVLADTEDESTGKPLATIEEATVAQGNIIACVKAGEVPLERLNRVERLVLIDCLDGCTIFANWGDNGINAQASYLHLHKAANALEEALSKAFGTNVVCPRG